MYIDCHVHCRDEKVSYKGETIEHALRVAENSRLDGIFDMPNIPDPVTTKKRVLERIALAEAANSEVFFGIYIGVTPDLRQVEEAVNCYREFFPKPEDKVGVIGLKMFAGKSVDDLTVSKFEEQSKVYKKLARLEYVGVLAVHCEKESEMNSELFDAENPVSHCNARPEKAEIESIKDQINLAEKAGYTGKLHIVHVSTPESVELVRSAKKYLRITCGATPHHLLLDNRIMQGENGIMYKMNPPLRSPKTRERLFECFIKGDIDVLESDHAPHSFEDKTRKHLSGIPNLASWPDFIEILKVRGASQELFDKVAFENINRIFGTSIKRIDRCLRSHIKDYVFDPYVSLKI